MFMKVLVNNAIRSVHVFECHKQFSKSRKEVEADLPITENSETWRTLAERH